MDAIDRYKQAERELRIARQENEALNGKIATLEETEAEHKRQMSEMKALLTEWLVMQKKDVDQMMKWMKTAENEVYTAATEWRLLFCDALALRVGQIGGDDPDRFIKEVVDGLVEEGVGFATNEKKRARCDGCDNQEESSTKG